mgnify:CR=1 FL=1|jgi:hypothetical protein|tara:strand:+ start:13 stop:945 length:933 start_codon:yes stop_codon:yes gene_type:complete
MAINVNTVYQTVLLILNKEQRGYMTPLEFNKIGAQTQSEIFGTYFESLNQQLRVPQANADYSDRVVNLDEKIAIFKDYGNATSVSSSNVFNLPNQYSGTSSATQQFTAVDPQLTYTLTGDALSLSNNNAISNVFVNGVELASTEYSVSGATLTLVNQPTAGQIIIINLYPKQFYRLGQVLYQVGALDTEEAQRVDRGELYHLLSSNLTKPTTVNPIYTYENNQLTVYPTSIVSGLAVSYIRKPIPPIWSFTSGSQYVFQPTSSCNFELHISEQVELIVRILLYAGVVVKNQEIVQVAASQIQQENINQKS